MPVLKKHTFILIQVCLEMHPVCLGKLTGEDPVSTCVLLLCICCVQNQKLTHNKHTISTQVDTGSSPVSYSIIRNKQFQILCITVGILFI